jgi:hypothetical protein
MPEWWKEGDREREKCLQSYLSSVENSKKDESVSKSTHPFICCHADFATPHEYEIHYELTHRHRCETCKTSWINKRLLSMHETENHDIFFKLRKEKETSPSYSCFLAHCNKKFTSEKTRKRHMIDAHRFSPDFPFTFINGKKK